VFEKWRAGLGGHGGGYLCHSSQGTAMLSWPIVCVGVEEGTEREVDMRPSARRF